MTTIAVFGLNGFLGKPIIEALLREPFISKIKTPIRLLTSSDKKPIESSKVQYYNVKEVGYDKPLDGVDVVVNLGSVPGDPKDDAFLKSIISHKVKLYIPSQFGTDLDATSETLPNFLQPKTTHSKAARDAGIKTVDIITGLFINEDGFLPFAPLYVLGHDVEKTKEATIRGDKNTLINPSYFKDIGNTVAALATKDNFASIPDKVRIYSDRILATELIKHYEKVNNVQLTTKYVSTADTVKEAKEKYSKGFKFDDFVFYLITLLAEGEGKGLIFEKENEKEFVNPKESLFKWTKFQI
ncbi:hypothetical protein WICANDRAFT_81061 [Wickerhamomyces anomalus NRRL Y-366-8]|uniref:Uncharacterized protein n=1 Tax=Wickerhamomyces anomalus (strain ATCC 58044 / CBS 1984 / NCYC 433 / NRRL Y-366-8) TaxID=683960 RepID=A0A1E3NX70_WICAA|nr:uncharacterized protein WICANDRAFT_81061 [Wickerhamomyces anomalus NRRL Y-366-8]ODQ57733.1 hypothetical protein WICANDRAFT_81061 [Wickerhamomyces anomalus NRRL Y-366-8]